MSRCFWKVSSSIPSQRIYHSFGVCDDYYEFHSSESHLVDFISKFRKLWCPKGHYLVSVKSTGRFRVLKHILVSYKSTLSSSKDCWVIVRCVPIGCNASQTSQVFKCLGGFGRFTSSIPTPPSARLEHYLSQFPSRLAAGHYRISVESTYGCLFLALKQG